VQFLTLFISGHIPNLSARNIVIAFLFTAGLGNRVRLSKIDFFSFFLLHWQQQVGCRKDRFSLAVISASIVILFKLVHDLLFETAIVVVLMDLEGCFFFRQIGRDALLRRWRLETELSSVMQGGLSSGYERSQPRRYIRWNWTREGGVLFLHSCLAQIKRFR
jgi:hypothetical protein